MMRYSAVGTPEAVREYLDSFAVHADADELMVAPSSPSIDARLRSLELLADVERSRPGLSAEVGQAGAGRPRMP